MKNVMNLVKLSVSNFMAIKKMALLMIMCFTIASIFNPQFGLMLIGITTYVISYQTMAYEDSYGIDHLICNLPVTRNQYVTSRYIFSFVALILACIIYSLVYFISLKYDLSLAASLDYKTNILMGIFSSSILISVSIPVLLKFGIKKAKMAMIFILMIMVTIPSVLVNDIDKNMEFFNKIAEMNIHLVLSIASLIFIIISYAISNYVYINKQITE